VPSTLVDAGPLIALFEPSDDGHGEAKAFLRRTTDQLVTNYPVLAEVTYMLTSAPRILRQFLTWAPVSLVVDVQTTIDFPRIIEIMDKYEDLPADFADASLLALGERRGIDLIATFDSDFDIYRTKSRKRLKNIFGRT
jgi:uncharacterized protein